MELVIDVVRGLFKQLQANPKGHLLMGLILGGLQFVALLGMMIPLLGMAFVLPGLDSDHALPAVAAFLAAALAGLSVGMLPYILLFYGYLRAAVREAEGGACVTPGQVWRDAQAVAGRIVLTNLLLTCVEFVGMLLCYLPGLIAIVTLWHTNGLVVAGGRRPVAALGEAGRTVMAAPLQHLALYAGFFLCALVSSWLPLIGGFVYPIVSVLYMARALRATYADVGAEHLVDPA